MARPVPAQVLGVQSLTLAADSTTPSRSVDFPNPPAIAGQIIALQIPIYVELATSDVAPISSDVGTTTNSSLGRSCIVYRVLSCINDFFRFSRHSLQQLAQPIAFLFTCLRPYTDVAVEWHTPS